MSDMNIDHIESLAGPLPKGREYARLTIGDKTIDWNDKADAALAEAYAVIERQARMLEVAVDWLAETEAWPTNATEAILSRLLARYEEKHHD
jgi:hypothetical protein